MSIPQDIFGSWHELQSLYREEIAVLEPLKYWY